MKIELTILGLLMEGNLYGYEIKKKIIERLKDYVDIKFGSIYYALKKAVENEWIKQVGTEKEGGNPERLVYEILPLGRKHFRKLLRQYFEQKFLHFEADIILMFFEHLDISQKEQFIESRKRYIENKIDEIHKRIETEADNSQEQKLLPLYSYLKHHLQAEREWLTSMKNSIQGQ
ncbi:MAG: PadR family transcriptional regulator [Spirochaetes bacterium]|nr:PadR family transcriptional regulator [Spirochaetota bacterium]